MAGLDVYAPRIARMTSQYRWYVSVQADRRSIADLELLVPGLLFCEVQQSWLSGSGDDPTALVSSEWDVLDEADLARDAAKTAVDVANAALRGDSLLHAKLQLGPAVWERNPSSPNGINRSIYVELSARGMALAGFAGTVTSSRNGYQTFPPRTVGLRQRELAERNVAFNTAVTLLDGAGDDFGRLWLVWEYVEKRSGHKPNRFAPKADIDAFCSTANNGHHIRHIGGMAQGSHRTMTALEARELIRRLLVGWLEAENPH